LHCFASNGRRARPHHASGPDELQAEPRMTIRGPQNLQTSAVVFCLFVFADVGKRGEEALDLGAPPLHLFDVSRRDLSDRIRGDVVLDRVQLGETETRSRQQSLPLWIQCYLDGLPFENDFVLTRNQGWRLISRVNNHVVPSPGMSGCSPLILVRMYSPTT
jgi:hypothetical protein